MRTSQFLGAVVAATVGLVGCAPPPPSGDVSKPPPVTLPDEPWNPFTALEVAEASLETGLGFEPVTGELREDCNAQRAPASLMSAPRFRFQRSATTTVTNDPLFERLLRPLASDLIPTCDALGVCRVVLIPGTLETVLWVIGTTGGQPNAGCFQTRGAEGFLAACGTHTVYTQRLGGTVGVAVEIAGLDEAERASFEALASKRFGGSLPFLLVYQSLERSPQATVRTTLGTVGFAFPPEVQRTQLSLSDGYQLLSLLDRNFWSERRKQVLTSPTYGSLLERTIDAQRDCVGQSLPFNDGEFRSYARALERLVDLRDGLNSYSASKAAGTSRFLECSQWAASQAPLCRAALGEAGRTTACDVRLGCSPFNTERD